MPLLRFIGGFVLGVGSWILIGPGLVGVWLLTVLAGSGVKDLMPNSFAPAGATFEGAGLPADVRDVRLGDWGRMTCRGACDTLKLPIGLRAPHLEARAESGACIVCGRTHWRATPRSAVLVVTDHR